MQYALVVYETPAELARREHPAEAEAYFGAYALFSKALQEAGVIAGGEALKPPHTATTVRVRGADRQVQDGPFLDTKEQLGGMFVIDVPDLDAALAWAAKCPSAWTGSVEVRPIMDMSGQR